VAGETQQVVTLLLEHWGLVFHTVAPLIVEVVVPPFSDAAKVFRASGTVHLLLGDFDDAVRSSFPNWVVATEGSYIFHRIVEYCRGLSPVGLFERSAISRGPSVTSLRGSSPDIPENSCFEVLSADKKNDLAVVFHFSIRAVGVEARVETTSIAANARSGSILPVGGIEGLSALELDVSGIELGTAFRAATRALEQFLRGMVADFTSVRAEVTRRALEEIGRAVREERQRIRRRFEGERLADKLRDASDFWEERRSSLSLISRPDRMEVALVAMTIETRLLTTYSGVLKLGDGRTRPHERVFDHCCREFAPVECEMCRRPLKVVHVGDAMCTHLVCEVCLARSGSCSHKFCGECAPTCPGCEQTVCPSCSLRCERCKKPTCSDHIAECQRCNARKCKRCLSLRCPVCNEEICGDVGCPICQIPTCAKHRDHRLDYSVATRCYKKWWGSRLRTLAIRFSLHQPNAEVPTGWLDPFHERERDVPLRDQILATILFPDSSGPYPNIARSARKWLSRRKGPWFELFR
jgi:hypothetical protein